MWQQDVLAWTPPLWPVTMHLLDVIRLVCEPLHRPHPCTMTRPRTITVVAWIFIVVGTAGLLNDLWPLATPHAAAQLAKLRSDGWLDLGPAWSLRALAIVGGVALLQGRNWARWLLAAWMLAHVVISIANSTSEMLMHLAIFAPLTYLIFRPAVDAFFRGTRAASA